MSQQSIKNHNNLSIRISTSIRIIRSIRINTEEHGKNTEDEGFPTKVEGRLKLSLHSLEGHRLRGDLTEVFKYYKDYNKEDKKTLRIRNQDPMRNNGLKLGNSRLKKEIGKNQFSNRALDDWNGLSN